ncbi:YcnI family copper-binding membrane protein [Nocardia callitridis]|uniref:YcnI family protein n=1 Tax=Nocardia callitridis TaxID=648753 RepID=A0ABP9K059_9NOCA
MTRSLSRACGTSVAAATLVLLGGGTAAAHVTVEAPDAQQNGYSVATFKVPTESDTANTVALTVTIPNLKSARTEPIPGWTAKAEHNDKLEVTAITWTANPGNPGVGPDQFQRFVVALGPLPAQQSVEFEAKQTYSDGKVVDWDQPTPPDGTEPEHPAPTLSLAPAGAEGHHGSIATPAAGTEAAEGDDTARWLGGIGLALGLLGVALGLGNVIRARRS